MRSGKEGRRRRSKWRAEGWQGGLPGQRRQVQRKTAVKTLDGAGGLLEAERSDQLEHMYRRAADLGAS